jgi:predicted acyltransferase
LGSTVFGERGLWQTRNIWASGPLRVVRWMQPPMITSLPRANPPTPPSLDATPSPLPISRPRLLALDAFRGFVMLLMLVVNSSTHQSFHWQFQHRGWNAGDKGASLCDMVFPWFLFAVGCAIPFSMGGGRGAGKSAFEKVWEAFKRALLIYALGALITAARRGEVTFFLWDILPIIAWGYFLGVILSLTPRWAQAVFVVAVLVAKWVMLTKINYPGEGMVLWEEKRHLDEWVKSNYLSIRGGPLWFVGGWFGGLTQLLPATCCVVMGMWAASLIRAQTLPSFLRAMWLIAAGLIALLLAYVWERDLAFSKDFFTSSYVLLASGSGAVVLGLFYLFLDVVPHPAPSSALVRAGSLLAPVWLCGVWTAVCFGTQFMAGTFGVDRATIEPWAAGMVGFGLAGLAAALLAPAEFAGPVRCVGWFCSVPGRNAILLYVGAEITWRIVLMGWKMPFHDGSMQTIGPALKGFVRDGWNFWGVSMLRWPGLGQAAADWAFTIAYTLVWWRICYSLYKRDLYFKV